MFYAKITHRYQLDTADRESLGILQIDQTISHMDGTTQQNAALVEQATAASESLAEQSNALAATVRSFKLAS